MLHMHERAFRMHGRERRKTDFSTEKQTFWYKNFLIMFSFSVIVPRIPQLYAQLYFYLRNFFQVSLVKSVSLCHAHIVLLIN